MLRRGLLWIVGLAAATAALGHDQDRRGGRDWDRDHDRWEHRWEDRRRWESREGYRYRPPPRYALPWGYVYDPYRGGYRFAGPGYPPPGWGLFIPLR